MSRLPDLKDPPASVPSYNENQDVIVMMPLFWSPFNRVPLERIRQQYLRSSLWVWNNWVENTDMTEYNVAMKWYLEDTVANLLRNDLERNFVNWDRDVMVFSAERLFGRQYSWLGGSGCMYCDPRLTDYQHVIFASADTYFGCPSGEKVPFFRMYFDLAEEELKQIMTVTVGDARQNDDPVGRLVRDDENIRNTLSFAYSCSEGVERGDMEVGWEKCKRELDRIDASFYLDLDANRLITTRGCISAFPNRHFRRHRKADLDFVVNAICSTGMDQTAWEMLALRTGENILDLSQMLGLEFIELDWHNLSELRRLDEAKKNYILHYKVEHEPDMLWRSHVGVS